MKVLNLIQGTQPWYEHRRGAHNASDAPVIMGTSKNISRRDLVRLRAVGLEREFSEYVEQHVLNKGHAVEPALRAMAERIIGEDLYPITATSDDGYLSASFDGVTLDESIIFEAKQPNAGKMEDIALNRIPSADYWQIVQQFAVNEYAKRCIYLCGDGTEPGTLSLWIGREQVEADIPKLLAGWAQFDADVAAYVPEQTSAPAPIAKPVEGFGSLALRVEGRVLASNLDTFRESADAFLARLPKPADLETDQDFADADAAVKACTEAESRIKAAKDAALAQMADVDAVLRTADTIAETIRAARLALDKAVKSEKERRRAEIVAAGADAVRAHYATINATLGAHAILAPQSLSLDIGASIKGLKSLASIKDAVDTAVANAKIDASQRAETVRASMIALTEAIDGHESLFPDRVTLCASKAPDDIRNLAAARIAEHKAREAERQAREAERASKQSEILAGQPAHQAQSMAPAAAVSATHAQGQAAAVRPGAKIKLGEINARIAPIKIDADGLAQLGFSPVGTERAAKLYNERDWPAICDAMMARIVAAATNAARAA